MSNKGFGDFFNVLMDLSAKFVEHSRGELKQGDLSGFLSELQNKGVEISDEMRSSVEVMLKSMNSYYNAVADTNGITGAVANLSDEAVRFVTDNENNWDQQKWENFLSNIRNSGLELTDETKTYVCGILDSAKEICTALPKSDA